MQDEPSVPEPVVNPHQEFHDHESSFEDVQQQAKKKIVRPKSLRALSAYEACKLECKRQRDQESAQEYVERLREELQLAEDQLAQRGKETVVEVSEN